GLVNEDADGDEALGLVAHFFPFFDSLRSAVARALSKRSFRLSPTPNVLAAALAYASASSDDHASETRSPVRWTADQVPPRSASGTSKQPWRRNGSNGSPAAMMARPST